MAQRHDKPSIHEGHFKSAFEKTSKKFPHIREDVARSVLFMYFERLETNRSKAVYEQLKPHEVRSLTLTELLIFDEERHQYHSLLGHYAAEYKKSAKKKLSPPPLPTYQDPNGQWAWKF